MRRLSIWSVATLMIEFYLDCALRTCDADCKDAHRRSKTGPIARRHDDHSDQSLKCTRTSLVVKQKHGCPVQIAHTTWALLETCCMIPQLQTSNKLVAHAETERRPGDDTQLAITGARHERVREMNGHAHGRHSSRASQAFSPSAWHG